jgi:hypothetical protein
MNDGAPFGGPDAGAQNWMVPGIALAVVHHRRRIATLLGRLDGLHREAVEVAVAAFEDGAVDAATLLVQFSDRLGGSDAQLERVVADLEARRVLPRAFH